MSCDSRRGRPMSLDVYLLCLAAVAVFFAFPPDASQLLIISNSIRYGLKRSAFTIAGDLTANWIQMAAAAFGLAAIIATSAGAFALIRWIGVAYLVWIGLRLTMPSEKSVDASRTGPRPPVSAGLRHLDGESLRGRVFRRAFPTIHRSHGAGNSATPCAWRGISGDRWRDPAALGLARRPRRERAETPLVRAFEPDLRRMMIGAAALLGSRDLQPQT